MEEKYRKKSKLSKEFLTLQSGSGQKQGFNVRMFLKREEKVEAKIKHQILVNNM